MHPSMLPFAPGALGCRYVRHKGGYSGGPARRVTALYYPTWARRARAAGSYGSSWAAAGTGMSSPLRIGSSSYIEHEVLPAFAPRLAATVWFS